MNRYEPFTDRSLMPDRSGQDVEALLRDFFRKEMPDPWPEPPAVKNKIRPVPQTLRPARPWHRARRHLALAAALALFVLGYWALGAFFPNVMPGAGSLDPIEKIVHVPQPPNFDVNGQTTPSGQKIHEYQHQENGTTFMKFESWPKPQKPSGK